MRDTAIDFKAPRFSGGPFCMEGAGTFRFFAFPVWETLLFRKAAAATPREGISGRWAVAAGEPEENQAPEVPGRNGRFHGKQV